MATVLSLQTDVHPKSPSLVEERNNLNGSIILSRNSFQNQNVGEIDFPSSLNSESSGNRSLCITSPRRPASISLMLSVSDSALESLSKSS